MKGNVLRHRYTQNAWIRFRETIFGITVVLALGGCFLLACSSRDIRKLDPATGRFTCEKPHLVVELNDAETAQYKGKKSGLFKSVELNRDFRVEVHQFLTSNGPFEIVIVQFLLPPTQNFYQNDQWYAETFLSGILVGEQDFQGQPWLEMIRFGDQNWFSKNKDWLYIGFFIKKRDYLVFINTGVNLYQHDLNLKQLKETRSPSDDQRQFLDIVFNRLASVFRIIE